MFFDICFLLCLLPTSVDAYFVEIIVGFFGDTNFVLHLFLNVFFHSFVLYQLSSCHLKLTPSTELAENVNAARQTTTNAAAAMNSLVQARVDIISQARADIILIRRAMETHYELQQIIAQQHQAIDRTKDTVTVVQIVIATVARRLAIIRTIDVTATSLAQAILATTSDMIGRLTDIRTNVITRDIAQLLRSAETVTAEASIVASTENIFVITVAAANARMASIRTENEVVTTASGEVDHVEGVVVAVVEAESDEVASSLAATMEIDNSPKSP